MSKPSQGLGYWCMQCRLPASGQRCDRCGEWAVEDREVYYCGRCERQQLPEEGEFCKVCGEVTVSWFVNRESVDEVRKRWLTLPRLQVYDVPRLAESAKASLTWATPAEMRKFADLLRERVNHLRELRNRIYARFQVLQEHWKDEKYARFSEIFVAGIGQLDRFLNQSEIYVSLLRRKANKLEDYLRNRY